MLGCLHLPTTSSLDEDATLHHLGDGALESVDVSDEDLPVELLLSLHVLLLRRGEGAHGSPDLGREGRWEQSTRHRRNWPLRTIETELKEYREQQNIFGQLNKFE